MTVFILKHSLNSVYTHTYLNVWISGAKGCKISFSLSGQRPTNFSLLIVINSNRWFLFPSMKGICLETLTGSTNTQKSKELSEDWRRRIIDLHKLGRSFLNNCRFLDHQFKQLSVRTSYLAVSPVCRGLEEDLHCHPHVRRKCLGMNQEPSMLKPVMNTITSTVKQILHLNWEGAECYIRAKATGGNITLTIKQHQSWRCTPLTRNTRAQFSLPAYKCRNWAFETLYLVGVSWKAPFKAMITSTPMHVWIYPRACDASIQTFDLNCNIKSKCEDTEGYDVEWNNLQRQPRWLREAQSPLLMTWSESKS